MWSPGEFVERYTGIGVKKAASPQGRLLMLGILAGVLIGMGAVMSNTAAHGLQGNLSVSRVVCGLLFPCGLIMVIFTGAELFTGNCLITISVLNGRTRWRDMARNLVLVYIGNLIGAVVLAALVVFSGQLDLSGGQLAVYTIQTALSKCSLPFGRAVVLGVLCNVLVCIAVMCALCGQDAPSKAIGAYLPICVFVICGFEHCVANMYYIPAGLLALGNPDYARLAAEEGLALEGLTWPAFLLGNLLPVTLGNALGGCGLAALMWKAHGSKEPARRAA